MPLDELFGGKSNFDTYFRFGDVILLPIAVGGKTDYLPVYRHSFRVNKHFSPITIGDRIKFYRYEKRMKQTELAEVVGIDVSTLKHYENTNNNHDLDKLSRIADVLEVDVKLLYDDYHLFLSDDYGAKIKELRKSLGLTQTTFAEKYNTSVKTIKAWEHERVRVSRKTYKKMFCSNCIDNSLHL